MQAHFIKLPNSTLAPDEPEAVEFLAKLKVGQSVKVSVTRARNYLFHKKYFALLNYAYDIWEPKGSFNKWGITPEKNFDVFRHDITILAGYSDVYYRVNGDVRVEAKSISFANMDEDDFSKLYEATIDVILKHVCTNYTGEELQNVVDQTMDFA